MAVIVQILTYGARTSLMTHRRLTKDAPTGFWHMNQSDIGTCAVLASPRVCMRALVSSSSHTRTCLLEPAVHYFQSGAPLTYHLIYPDGKNERHVLGPDIGAGHTMQVLGGAGSAAKVR